MRSKSSTSRLVTTILTGCLHKKVPPTLTRISSRHRASSPLTTIIFNRQPPHKLTMRSRRAFTGLVCQSLKLAKPKGTTRRPKQTTGLKGLMKLVQTRNFCSLPRGRGRVGLAKKGKRLSYGAFSVPGPLRRLHRRCYLQRT